MFYTAVKVLFLRQIYGFKHRWIATGISVLLPVVLLSLLHTGREGRKRTTSRGVRNPFEVVVMPYNSEIQQLVHDAHKILNEDNSPSVANLRMVFVKNTGQMNQSLRNSNWSSVGVQFQEVSHDKLEYTLEPVTPRRLIFPRKFYPPLPAGFSNADELPHVFLQLQAAIDAAYIRKYFPQVGYLRLQRFQDFPTGKARKHEGIKLAGVKRTPEEALISSMMFIVYASFVSFGLMIPMCVLASYIIRDKLSGVRELLCVNGVPRWMVSASWLFTYCLIAIVVALSLLAPLKLPLNDPLLSHINVFLLAILLIVYYWSGLVFSNFVANLLTSQLLTGLLLEIYWMVTTFVSWVAALKLRNDLVTQLLVSLLPNFGYTMFMCILMEFINGDTVLSFENLFSNPDEYISAGMVLLMMVINIFIFLSLVFYLDAVKPGPYGRAKPWYLFKRSDNSATVRPADAPDGALVIQEIEDGVPIGLRCANIVKIFGTHKALNNVNLKIVKNSITILLGHNGAGKTTLFSILCGMFSPSSGEVYTDEYNIFEGNNIDKFRRVLGYCPQENLLIRELTVQEHLIIFGMLKGLNKSDALAYSDEWATKFDMFNIRSIQAKNLSGGAKRKLCLAIAMTGDPEYLLLDEPSAGLDIESTRKFCDLVLEEKGKCTVIISTHNMDEADILGDRIAILANGQLKYYGESSFLKRVLDTGYRLTCTVSDTSTQDVIKTVTWYIKGASVLYKMNRSITFRLPSNMMESVPNLLRWLEVRYGKNVSSTLSPSTLDDVFVEVQKDLGVKIDVEELPSIAKDEMSRSCCNFSALFRRRTDWMLSRRMFIMIILVMLLPSLAMIGGMFLLNASISPADSDESNLTPSFKDPNVRFALISSHGGNTSDLVRTALMKSGFRFKETSNASNGTLIDAAHDEFFVHQSTLLFTLDTQKSNDPTAYFLGRSENSISNAYSAVINAILQGRASIITHHTFFERPQHFRDIVCPISQVVLSVSGTLFAIMITPFFLGISAYFVVFPHEERTTLFKHLLLMTGLLPAVYWLVNLMFDMMIYVSSCALILTIMAITDHFYLNLFLNPQVLFAFVLVLGLYGLSSIMFSYIWSFVFHSNATAILFLVSTSYFLTSIFLLFQSVLPSYFSVKYVYFLPFTVLRISMEHIALWALHKKACEQCQTECQYTVNHPLFQQELKPELICFGALTIGYFLVLMFLDHGLGRRGQGAVQRCCFGKIDEVDDEVDPEVAREKQRVNNLVSRDGVDYPQLVCSNLGKKYSCRKTAVYDVTFTAERGECFGLVGVNGAGKTTTFQMLAAMLCVSKGTAIIEGQWSLKDCEYTYMKRVGYCPQHGGLLNELSARTILRLFGQLVGIPRSQIEPLVNRWIEALDMTQIDKRPCGHYSGGNKRKLSLAVALIGNPPVLLLDEPTAGVDPVVRRRIWEILAASLEHNEQAVVLTSHTMSECEAICDRLTILVNGVMKCLGPIPVLKETFGKSYILDVKFTPNSTAVEQEMVQYRIESRFSGNIELEDSQLNRLRFVLKTDDLKMYDLFAAMLKIKYWNSRVIEDFYLSETPLEQVFLMFAKKH